MRLIGRLEIKDKFVIKPIQYEGLRKVGKPEDIIYDFYQNDFDEILLDLKKPGWESTLNYVDNIYTKLNSSNLWKKRYEKDGIVLFSREE